jgi:hypothetical protein
MYSVMIYSAGLSPAKLDGLVSENGGFRISRILDESSKTMTADPDD